MNLTVLNPFDQKSIGHVSLVTWGRRRVWTPRQNQPVVMRLAERENSYYRPYREH